MIKTRKIQNVKADENETRDIDTKSGKSDMSAGPDYGRNERGATRLGEASMTR